MKIPGETSRPSPLTAPTLDLRHGGRRGVWIDLQDPASIELICAEGPDWIGIEGSTGNPNFTTFSVSSTPPTSSVYRLLSGLRATTWVQPGV